MEYFVGIILSLAVIGFAHTVGFDRERAFYPTVLVVTASYYVLFAVIGASSRALIIEIVVATAFVIFALAGFKKSFWLLAAGFVGHAVFDFVHRFFINNPGVPAWWPGFCLAFDVPIGVFLAARLTRRSGRISS